MCQVKLHDVVHNYISLYEWNKIISTLIKPFSFFTKEPMDGSLILINTVSKGNGMRIFQGLV